MPETTIQIEQDEYMDMYRDVMLLRALEAAGVDNWEGWDQVDRDWVEEQVSKELEAIEG